MTENITFDNVTYGFQKSIVRSLSLLFNCDFATSEPDIWIDEEFIYFQIDDTMAFIPLKQITFPNKQKQFN